MAAGDEASRRWRPASAKPTMIPAALVALLAHPSGPVHAVSHVVGDRLVQLPLRFGELEAETVGVALREQALALERAQVLLHQPPHHVADVGHGRTVTVAVAQPARKALGIDQGHECEEVLVLAVVGCGCEQQQVAGALPQRLPPA